MAATETIGADLGGTKLLVGVIDERRTVNYRGREPSAGSSEEEVIATLGHELDQAQAARPGVTAAGIGIPCTIDRERGVAINAVNLPISNVPIRDLMSERLGMPVSIDNDANVAALAEHRFGAARGAQNAVLLTVGTGIGGGLIINGEIYRGSTGAGAELGHIVIQEDGPRCQGTCPNHGCAEALASGTALERNGREAAERERESALGRLHAAGEEITGPRIVEAARQGDAVAREVIAVIGRHLGTLFSSLANIFDPDVIVVGGGVSAAGDLLLDPARRELAARALPPMNRRVRVTVAELGADAGMIGAATLAREELEARDQRARGVSRWRAS